MDLNEKILSLIKETTYRLLELQKEIASKLNIKKSFYKVLVKLGDEKKPVNQTILGDLCGVDKPAISRLIANMEKENLILKRAKDGNKKEFMISITDKGLKILEKVTTLMDELKLKYFNELEINEKEIFVGIFEKLLEKEEKDA